MIRSQQSGPLALAALVGLLAVAALPTHAQAQPPATESEDPVDAAVRRGVRYLMSEQYDDGQYEGAINEGQRHQNLTSMTALAIMSMAAVGHQPTEPTPEGRAMHRGLDFVLKPDNRQQGYYFGADGSRMYGHGITTLMLGEMLGMGVDDEQDREIRHSLNKAVQLILASQRVNKGRHHRGGWRYSPHAGDSDLSVSVWQVMALRSAKNAGLDVPSSAIDEAVEYIGRCYSEHHEAFAYQPGGRPDFAMVSAGLLSMQVCGRYEDQRVLGAADWLVERRLNYDHNWFFYGTYYYAQSMYQRGGRHADRGGRRVDGLLVRQQSDDGSWVASGGQERQAGRVYTTSMAVLSLSVKHHYLPIYQR